MEKSQSRPSFRNYLWLLLKVLKVAPWLATCWCLISLITAGMSAIGLLVLREAVNTLVTADTVRTALPWLITLCIFYFLGQAISIYLPFLREQLRIKAGYALQRTVLEKISKLPIEAFDDEDTHNLISRASGGGDGRAVQLLGSSLALIEILPTIIMSIFILGMVSIWIAVSVVIGSLLLRFLEIQMGTRIRHFEVENTQKQRLASYYAQLLTGRHTASEIRIWCIGDILLGRWAETLKEYFDLKLRIIFKNNCQGLLHTFGFITFLTTALVIIARTQGSIEPGLAALVLSALWNTSTGMNSIQGYVLITVQHAGYGEDLHRLLNDFQDEATSATATQQGPYTIRDNICLHNVSYRYPGTETYVLKNITMEIRAGETLALVGTNGAGKTTLAHILAGLRPLTQGHITIDNTDIATLTSEAHRRSCTMVFQHPVHYPASLQDNVKLNDEHKPNSYLEATLAHVGLPESKFSLDTFLGPEFGGVDLSGGEWQRVAIARCLIKKGTQFIIFDEPTASLDPMAEMEIFEQFIELVEGRTALLIAHRLGPTRFADRVAMLENGHLVEIGKPADLLSKNSKYAHMFATQQKWYK